MEKIGLVTITYNSADVLKGFLDSTFKQSFQNFIIYIIDNNSQDDTVSIIEKDKDERIVLIRNSENFGVAKANNQGIKLALKDDCYQVLIVNNDIEFEEQLFNKMLNIQKENNCSLVVPKMMYFDNPNYIWYAGSDFIKSKGYLPIHKGIKQKDKGQCDGVFQVEYAPTCCLLVKKQVFEDIGFMDEKYFVYFDDTDFSYRIFQDGRHKLFYFSNTIFYHKVGSLTKSFNHQNDRLYRDDFFLKQFTKNHIYFLKKAGGVYSYLFIIWLFFRNNIRFIINPRIRKNFTTFLLINRSYFQGIRM